MAIDARRGQQPDRHRASAALEICGKHLTPAAVAGADYLLKSPPKYRRLIFFAEVYLLPDRDVSDGRCAFFAVLRRYGRFCRHQQQTGAGLYDGNDRTGGRNYCTAMAVLALTVEYQYLPIYQR